MCFSVNNFKLMYDTISAFVGVQYLVNLKFFSLCSDYCLSD
jgi:hypothetical protein